MRSRFHGAFGWEDATPTMIVEWLRFVDSQGNGTTIVYATSCPQGDQHSLSCFDLSLDCTRRYAFGSVQKSFISKIKRAQMEILGPLKDWSSRGMRSNSETLDPRSIRILPLRRWSNCERELYSSRRPHSFALIHNKLNCGQHAHVSTLCCTAGWPFWLRARRGLVCGRVLHLWPRQRPC